MTRLLRDTMEEWAGEVRVPYHLADRALRRRAWSPVAAAVLATGLAVVVAVLAVGLHGPNTTVRPANGVSVPVLPTVTSTDVRADIENAPPKRFVAAGDVAVSAYWTTWQEPLPDGAERVRRTWYLYDPRSDGYEKTAWAWLDVAPGLQLAAVLQGDMIGRRVGILDMNSREVMAWIDLEHDVGSLVWSPDGTKVLATAYSRYPEPSRKRASRHSFDVAFPASPRIGYYLIDVATGEAAYHRLPALDGTVQPGNSNGRQDLGWSLDGSMLWEPTDTMPDRLWLSLDGRRQEGPPGDQYIDYSAWSKVSPDGTRVLSRDLPPARPGKQVVLQTLAWADNDNVLALGCAGTCGSEFDNGLVLVSVDGERTTQLTGNRDRGGDDSWHWVLTRRN
ncbi:hypothetical protein [Nonomuraea jiangxiensis]|uniref:WD40-like Beta Propeller Repeat n=1 Tax=Nonomuraea jiangxiensis TaxID=633440 RepID=A0A1G8MID2_9ACTN|nr:hypothetical protein [Nonomuraea jiangxiensis]SDI67689.1 hypothetical protein SAMN05421869_106421 [Nonomuraea jiangxiensis]